MLSLDEESISALQNNVNWDHYVYAKILMDEHASRASNANDLRSGGRESVEVLTAKEKYNKDPRYREIVKARARAYKAKNREDILKKRREQYADLRGSLRERT